MRGTFGSRQSPLGAVRADSCDDRKARSCLTVSGRGEFGGFIVPLPVGERKTGGGMAIQLKTSVGGRAKPVLLNAWRCTYFRRETLLVASPCPSP
jgi:hypothetical protein